MKRSTLIIGSLLALGLVFTSCSDDDPLFILADKAAPTFTSSNVASVNENQTSAITLVATDLSTVTYTITGGDSASFNINVASGIVTFKGAPDFESGKTTYTFTAIATDVSGNTATQSVVITVLDVNEVVPDVTPPTFTSNNTASVNENQRDAITLVATDASVVTYSISGGDFASFDVNATTGVVTFKVAPDFETKQNYGFTAMATDASDNNVTQSVAVNILDVEDMVHNGLTYGVVTSPSTGKVWLDRDLGASQICTYFNEPACAGDNYQWGRNFDGHQDSNSSTSTIQAADIDNAGIDFIASTTGTYAYDWAYNADANGSLRMENWSKTDGSSVCPVNYRVPTTTELRNEITDANVTSNEEAFDTFLKLPSTKWRDPAGSMSSYGYCHLWVNSVDGTKSYMLELTSSDVIFGANSRAYGFPVRCIKD